MRVVGLYSFGFPFGVSSPEETKAAGEYCFDGERISQRTSLANEIAEELKNFMGFRHVEQIAETKKLIHDDIMDWRDNPKNIGVTLADSLECLANRVRKENKRKENYKVFSLPMSLTVVSGFAWKFEENVFSLIKYINAKKGK